MKPIGRTLRLSAPGTIGRFAEHLRKGVTETLEAVLGAAEGVNIGVAAIDADKNLSGHGRVASARALAAKALAQLKAVEDTTVKNLSTRAGQLENKLRTHVAVVPPTDPAARLAYEMSMRELRDQIRLLSPSERVSLLQTTKDPLVITSLAAGSTYVASKPRPDGSVRLEPMVPDAERSAALLVHAETADPTTAAALREVRDLHQAYSLAIATVRQEIEEAVGATAPELAIHTS